MVPILLKWGLAIDLYTHRLKHGNDFFIYFHMPVYIHSNILFSCWWNDGLKFTSEYIYFDFKCIILNFVLRP